MSTRLYINDINKEDFEDVRIYIEQFFSSPSAFSYSTSELHEHETTFSLEVLFPSEKASSYFLDKKFVVVKGEEYIISEELLGLDSSYSSLNFKESDEIDVYEKLIKNGNSSDGVNTEENAMDSCSRSTHVSLKEESDYNSSNVVEMRDDNVQRKQVLVTEIPANMKPNVFKMLMENMRRSGGGETEDIQMDLCCRSAVVTFKEESVAKRVLGNASIKFKEGEILKVSAPPSTDRNHIGSFELIHASDTSGTSETKTVESKTVEAMDNLSEDVMDTLNLQSGSTTYEDDKPSDDVEMTDSRVHKRKVLISDIPANMKPNVFKMLMENTRRSGGGETEDIQMDPCSRSAVVTFKEESVAERVLCNASIKYGESEPMKVSMLPAEMTPNSSPTISATTTRPTKSQSETAKKSPKNSPAKDALLRPTKSPTKTDKKSPNKSPAKDASTTPPKSPTKTADTFDEERLESEDARVESRTVEATGSLDEEGWDKFNLYSESVKFGGGEYEEFKLADDMKSAIIVFKEEAVARSFVQRSPHTIGQTQITTVLVLNLPEVQPRSVRITSLQGNLDYDTLNLMLELKRHVGKDADLEELCPVDERNAVATFYDPQSVDKLNLDKSKYGFTILRPTKAPYLVDHPVDPRRLLFFNLPPTYSFDTKAFLKFVGMSVPTKIRRLMYCPHPDQLVAEFESSPDYDSILVYACSRAFMHKIICVQRMQIPTSLQIQLERPVKYDFLDLFFLNKVRSGAVMKRLTESSPTCFIVEYENRTDVENVMNKGLKIISSVPMQMYYYDACIGPLPPNFDPLSSVSRPKDIEYSIDSDILKFWLDPTSKKEKSTDCDSALIPLLCVHE